MKFKFSFEFLLLFVIFTSSFLVFGSIDYNQPLKNKSIFEHAQAQDAKSANTVVCDPAQNQVGCINNPVKNTTTIGGLFTKLMNIIFGLIAITTVVMIMLGGFQMIVNSGNPSKRGKAKDRIVWAIIGLVITLMSYTIVSIVQKIIG